MALVYKQLTLEKPNLIKKRVSMAHLCFINDTEPVVRVPTRVAAYATNERRSFHYEQHRAPQTVNTSILLNTAYRPRQSAFVCSRCKQFGTSPVTSPIDSWHLHRTSVDAEFAHAFRFRALFGVCISYILVFKRPRPTPQKTHSPPLKGQLLSETFAVYQLI
jgi:hypothetical protein